MRAFIEDMMACRADAMMTRCMKERSHRTLVAAHDFSLYIGRRQAALRRHEGRTLRAEPPRAEQSGQAASSAYCRSEMTSFNINVGT